MKFSITEEGSNWIVVTISHQGSEVSIDASEIACNPVLELIQAAEHCCIYGETHSFTLDAEGVLYKLCFICVDEYVDVKVSYLPPSVSQAKHESLLFSTRCESIELIRAVWRGLKAFLSTCEAKSSLNDLAVIEKYIKNSKK